MTSFTHSQSSARHAVRNGANEAHRQASPWVERLARVGYAAKGIIYLLVGLLAVQAAIGSGGEIGGSKNALATLRGDWWFGTALLWIIAIGLSGYAIWQFFRAALDPEHEGDDAKGIATRAFFVISGIIHASLAVWIYTHLLTSSGGGGGDGSGTQGLVSRVLEWGTIGQLLVAATGVAIAGFGIQQLIKAWKVDLSDQLSLASMSETTRKTTIYTGRAGLAARGVVFMIVGWFFVQAAWQSDGGEAGGLAEAMSALGGFGPWVLGLVALGLAAYGVFMLVKARYRRINP